MQAATLQAGLSLDCPRFDRRGLCVSVGGRRSQAQGGPIGAVPAGQIVVGYRPAAGIRLGAFAEGSGRRGLSDNLRKDSERPMVGVFGQWNHRDDGHGLAVRASASFADDRLTMTRSGSSTVEAGQGNTRMASQGYQVLASFAYPLAGGLTVAPYAGTGYQRIRTAGYTEAASSQVASPLRHDALTHSAWSALAGIGVSARLSGQVSARATVGVQHHLRHSMGDYTGSSEIPGLGTFSVQAPKARRTLATASAGPAYDLARDQRLGVNLLWQQQAIGPNVVTAIAAYTIGF